MVEPGTPLLWNWHIDAICEHLQAVTDGRIRRLLINIPPGHMKSLLVSVFWPAWVWARRPEWRALFSSYAMDLAIRDSVRCRDLITSEWYQEGFCPPWGLKGDQNVKSFFENTRRGFRFSLSVGGRATGFRGDCVVVDDPLNAKEQYSKTARDECVFWWDKVMSSRLNDQRVGARVIIMQRLHEEDLAGHVIRKEGYEHLCLPTEFEPERLTGSGRDHIPAATRIGWRDPRTEPGELLFPTLFSAPVVTEAKRDLGADGFAGQHQQRPSPADGTIFKRAWWQYYRQAPAVFDVVIQSWDCSFKDTKGTDYVVGQVWGRLGADKYLLDQVRDRMDFTATCAALKSLSAKWSRAAAKLIEDKANGPAVISALRRQVSGLIPVEPDGSKVARAHAVSADVEAGNVYLPEGATFTSDFVEELASFPNGTYDDQVDAATQALRRLSSGATTASWADDVPDQGPGTVFSGSRMDF